MLWLSEGVADVLMGMFLTGTRVGPATGAALPASCEAVTEGGQEELYQRRQVCELLTWRRVRTEKPFPGLLKNMLLHFACEPCGSILQASTVLPLSLDPVQKGLFIEEAEKNYLPPGRNMERWKESWPPLKMI